MAKTIREIRVNSWQKRNTNDIAIRVENLSKRYCIGLKEEMHDTLFGAMADFIRQPIKNLRRLSRFEENCRNSEDIIWAQKDVSFGTSLWAAW